jgi:valyl-tRNA synthetase
MVMLCQHLAAGRTTAERIPFRMLYLHSLVLDAQGQKMSKMRGNVIDPLEWMERFGTDALRFTLAIKAAPGTDIALSEEAVSGYKAFANKIWNAARFVFVNLEKFQAATGMSIEELASPQVRAAAPYPTGGAISLADRWIFSRLAETIATIDDALEQFRFHKAADVVYHFFWGDFCDWYIEWVKPAMADGDREIAVPTWRNLFAVFEAALRLLHPLMPFLTEELWHRLPQRAPSENKNARSIALQPFPRPAPQWSDPDAEQEVKLLQEVIVAARNVRAELKLDPRRRVTADLAPASAAVRAVIENNRSLVLKLATLSDLHFSDAKLEPSSGPVRSTSQFDLRIAHGDGAELGAELTRLRKEKERLTRDLESKRNRLADETFRSRAPAEVVRQLEATFAERQLEFNKLTERLAQLEKSDGNSAAK